MCNQLLMLIVTGSNLKQKRIRVRQKQQSAILKMDRCRCSIIASMGLEEEIVNKECNSFNLIIAHDDITSPHIIS